MLREAQTVGDVCTSCSAFSRNSPAVPLLDWCLSFLMAVGYAGTEGTWYRTLDTDLIYLLGAASPSLFGRVRIGFCLQPPAGFVGEVWIQANPDVVPSSSNTTKHSINTHESLWTVSNLRLGLSERYEYRQTHMWYSPPQIQQNTPLTPMKVCEQSPTSSWVCRRGMNTGKPRCCTLLPLKYNKALH